MNLLAGHSHGQSERQSTKLKREYYKKKPGILDQNSVKSYFYLLKKTLQKRKLKFLSNKTYSFFIDGGFYI